MGRPATCLVCNAVGSSATSRCCPPVNNPYEFPEGSSGQTVRALLRWRCGRSLNSLATTTQAPAVFRWLSRGYSTCLKCDWHPSSLAIRSQQLQRYLDPSISFQSNSPVWCLHVTGSAKGRKRLPQLRHGTCNELNVCREQGAAHSSAAPQHVQRDPIGSRWKPSASPTNLPHVL